MKVVVVIYEGGRIPGAAEEGAAAGEMIGEGEQNRWWQYNASMALSKNQREYANMPSLNGAPVARASAASLIPPGFLNSSCAE